MLRIGALLLVACGPNSVDFTATIGPFPTTTTQVLANGSALDLEPTPNGTPGFLVTYETSYDSYAAARRDAIAFDVYAGQTSIGSGSLSAGICAEDCAAPACPPIEDLTAEEVTVIFPAGSTHFDDTDIDCFRCTGDGHHSLACP